MPAKESPNFRGFSGRGCRTDCFTRIVATEVFWVLRSAFGSLSQRFGDDEASPSTGEDFCPVPFHAVTGGAQVFGAKGWRAANSKKDNKF